MLIESNANHRLLRTLNFGTFPRNVSSFESSYEYLEKLIYHDYQAQKRYDGIRGLDRVHDNNLGKASDSDFLDSVINSIESINADYSTGLRSYQEVFYSVIILAYLYLLKNDKQSSLNVLRSFRFDNTLDFETETDKQFYGHLYARYCTLLGLSLDNHECWTDFLMQLEKYGETSETALNQWIQFLCQNLIRKLSLNGTKPLIFQDFESLGLPKSSFVVLMNCSLKPQNEAFISKSLFQEYSKYLTHLLGKDSSNTKTFPDSDNTDNTQENFTHSLYESLNDITTHRDALHQLLKPKTSKSFLISQLETTYQSRNILVNMIKTQTDLKLYDEAIAAIKTYNSYVLKEREQNGDQVKDILQILDIFSHCFKLFNPLNSFQSEALFKYNDIHEVLDALSEMVPLFVGYLSDASKLTSLSFESQEVKELSEDDEAISFLYFDPNPQSISNTGNKLTSKMANACFSLSSYYQFLAAFESSESESMLAQVNSAQEYLKKALLLNRAQNASHLYSYALILAQRDKLRSCIKLCKFTLKKFPNSFKTWNLLALATSATERKDFLEDTSVAYSDTSNVLKNQSPSHKEGDVDLSGDTSKLSISRPSGMPRSEVFIEDALNLASIFLLKQKKVAKEVHHEIKYEIIQLKLTQLELKRQKYGANHTFDMVSELFDFYREIYSVSTTTAASHTGREEKRWSHRPSIIDPHKLASVKSKEHSMPRSINGTTKESSEVKRSIDGESLRSSRRTNEKKISNSEKKSSSRESLVLQEIWLWTAGMYQELELYDEAEQCIVEAETVHEPNARTYTALGILASKSRKFLALQEFEKSLELYHQSADKFNKSGYGITLMAMCQLFMIDDEKNKSLFISQKDRDAGLVRLKTYLEDYSHCWPHGHTNAQVWYFLSLIYEKFDDKILYEHALWSCVDMDSSKPARPYSVTELGS